MRWVALTNKDGAGLLAVGMPLLSVSAWPYTMWDLERARHVHELPRRDSITVNLDYKQMGVGGDNSWGARTHPEYTLPAGPYSYKFSAAGLYSVDGRDWECCPVNTAQEPVRVVVSGTERLNIIAADGDYAIIAGDLLRLNKGIS